MPTTSEPASQSGPARLPAVPPGPWRDQYPFVSRRLDLRGGASVVHYLDEGAGPPVVMVHGNPTWSFMWRTLAAGLDGFRRLAPDHLGMGLSSRPGPEYGFRLADRIEDFGRWLDRVEPERPVHLVVHDWGGPIGLGWAVRHPGRVASLAIMNTGLRWPAGWRMPWRLRLFRESPALSRLLAVDLGLFASGLARRGTFRPMSRAAESGFLAPYRLAAHRRAVGAFVRDIPLDSRHPSHEALAEIDRSFRLVAGKPALLCWGLGDFVFGPMFLADFRRRCPKAEVLALETAGHHLLEDEPARILAAVRRHLDRAA